MDKVWDEGKKVIVEEMNDQLIEKLNEHFDKTDELNFTRRLSRFEKANYNLQESKDELDNISRKVSVQDVSLLNQTVLFQFKIFLKPKLKPIINSEDSSNQ